MASNENNFKTAIFDDGTCGVLRSDPAKPNYMELIATFHDSARAREYAKFQNHQFSPNEEADEFEEPSHEETKHERPRHAEPAHDAEPARHAEPAHYAETVSASTRSVASRKASASDDKSSGPASDISDRQQAVLDALRSMMDKKNQVEVRSAELAQAAFIPLGSLHSVLASLEKKNLIRTERQGSARFRAIYEVLSTSRKRANSVNGSHHEKKPNAVDTRAG